MDDVDCRQVIAILRTFCTDGRCEVHQCLLAVRETRHGWFDLFCPGAVACIDNGQLYSAMVQLLQSLFSSLSSRLLLCFCFCCRQHSQCLSAPSYTDASYVLFLSLVNMQSAISLWQICPSVRHTRVFYLNQCTYRQTPPSGLTNAVCRALPLLQNCIRNCLSGVVKYTRWKNLPSLTQIAVCLGNGTR